MIKWSPDVLLVGCFYVLDIQTNFTLVCGIWTHFYIYFLFEGVGERILSNSGKKKVEMSKTS